MAVAKKKNTKPSEAKAVWEKKNPVRTHKHLTAAQKATAKKRAAKAGRQYPNMVDNMAVLHGGGESSPAGRKKATPAKKPTAKKTATTGKKTTAAKKATATRKPAAKKSASSRRPTARKPGPKTGTTRKTAKS